MRTRIKICCLTSRDEAQFAIAAGADAVGFVGVKPPSPRAIADESIAAIAARIPPPIATFLLTSERTAEGIASQVMTAGTSAVQIVVPIGQREAKLLAARLPAVRRVQVIHVENERALELVDRYAPYVHAFLLDSGKPSRPKPEYGGTGQTHDWSISAEFVRLSPHPVFLAGGLTSENVAEAMKVVRPFGVDLCTGVRTGGRLDPGKLQAFVGAVHRADAEMRSI